MNERLNRVFHNSNPRSKFVKKVRIIAAILGFIGIVNTIILGVYIVLTYVIMSKFKTGFYAIQTYSALLLIGISAVLLIYGSYHQWRMHRRGYLINMFIGGTVAVVYAYFILIVPVLNWLGMLGVALLIPAPLSGVLGALIKNFERNAIKIID